GGSTPLKSFTLSGSLLEDAVITRSIISYATGNDISPTATVDLNDFAAQSGNYVLQIRSGLSGEGSQADEMALYQNVTTLYICLMENLASFAIGEMKDRCLKSMMGAVYSKAKIVLAGSLDPSKLETDFILKEIVLPSVKDELKNLVNCSNRKPDQLLASLTEMLEHILESLDVLPVLTMNGAWLLGTRAIDHCKYLQPDNTIVNCFSFEKAALPSPTNYACDTIVLKMRAVEDKSYYPYKGDPVANINFNWVTTSGNGVFPPDNSINVPARTDDFGEASVKWILPNTSSSNSARAVVFNKGDEYAKADFSTTTVLPKPKFVTGDKSDHQIGAIDHYLPNKITISINDQNDG
ncbi:MAG TPA: hypothetical protein VFS31_16345, partial [Chitinophagaceae bacterium]|nr:hypothetical protein [Chitinophagaceae bacterium]